MAITGSICTGKSFVCKILLRMGFPVFCWDFEIRKLMRTKKIYDQIKIKFPTAATSSKIDRKLLGEIIFKDAFKRQILEDILYEPTLQKQNRFVELMSKKGFAIAFFEVPLLYEKGLESLYDYALVTYAAEKVMLKRAEERKLNLTTFYNVLKIQMSSPEKKVKADYAIDTDKTVAELTHVLKDLIREVLHERNNS